MERERFESSAWVPPWTRSEHHARYAFAAREVAGRVVVDCASGDGTGAAIYARAGAAAVKAFDLSPAAVAAARARHPGIDFQEADALALPLPPASADVFVSLETIEHLAGGEDAARAFVAEVARVLKPDGVFVCSTPNRAVYNPGKPPDARPWNRFHVRELDRDEFAAILGSRFRVVRTFGQNPRSRALASAAALVGRAPGTLAVRCIQLLKLASAPFDRPEQHAVVPADPAVPYEYLVAVCSDPRR